MKAVKDRNPLVPHPWCCSFSRATTSFLAKENASCTKGQGMPREIGDWMIWFGVEERGNTQSHHPYQALSPKCALATPYGFPVRDLLEEFLSMDYSGLPN